MDSIKPIKPVAPVERGEIQQTRIGRNLPKTPATIKPPSGGWEYSNGHLTINGQEVGRLIENSLGQPAAFWSALANDLDQFRKYYICKNSKKRKKKIGGETIVEEIDPTGELGHLSALVEAYIAKIMRILKRKYDETTDGLAYNLDNEGQLLINGMNVTSFIRMARDYPSKKAQVFLQGLKNRLSIILSNKTGSPNYEKVKETTYQLIREIDVEMKRIVEKDRLIDKS